MSASFQPVSREVALRIGLAAKALPGMGTQRLLTLLLDVLGEPLTEEKLAQLTLKDLRAGLQKTNERELETIDFEKSSLLIAIQYLHGQVVSEAQIEAELPTIEAPLSTTNKGFIRVAVASNQGEKLDGHFGACLRFLIYQVGMQDMRLVAIRNTAGSERAEDRNAFRTQLIEDCHVLYVQSIGGPAAAKVVRAGLHPVKVQKGGEAREEIKRLQDVLNNNPPPWLAKIMGLERKPMSAEALA